MTEQEDPRSEATTGAEEEQSSALRTFLGLFVVPLLVVMACVAVFIGFGWIAYDRQGTSDYLNDLRSSWKPRRAQAAYELSKILTADPTALDQEPGIREEVRRLFAETDDEQMKRYLALVLGYTQDPEAVPLLIEALDDSSSETRIYALWGLGKTNDPRAVSPLLEALEDPDPGIRKTAAFGLGELGDPEAIPELAPLLDDEAVDVRWNAALALANLGSDLGVPVLYRMLDRSHTAQIPDITPAQTEEAMISAVRALASLKHLEAHDRLDRLATDDPNLKVRQAAIEALRLFGT
jgi:HEAT repeat protein